jgi:hydroxylamine dehydrogenase
MSAMNSVKTLLRAATILLVTPCSLPAGFTLKEMSPQSKACADCHKKESTGIYQQWGASKHYRGNVGCYECHMALPGEPDAFDHYDQRISTIVTPKDCGRCHEQEVGEFNSSHHAKGGRILGSLDNVLAEIVEGNRGLKTASFPGGISAAAVNGCWQCHGSEVKIKADGKPDPATWPNTGIGRINPDGSEGSCAACHFRHDFSVAQARTPDTCGKCHMGPDHPQIEIYNESKHGIAYRANVGRMALTNSKWIVGEDYAAAPNCATCHMSATKNQRVSHDIGMRISWNNRPEISVRPEVSDAKLGLPGRNVTWQTRRANMMDVCLNCHNQQYVDAFYQQYDALIDLYHEKFAKPGLALYAAARPLLRPAQFSNPVDFTWYEIWHHEGRRARHGASMMGPDYTHWHGTYEVAKHFYAYYIPKLEELVERNQESADPAKKSAAENLAKLLDVTLNSTNHQWYLNKMSPEEKAARDQQREEFQKRYSK